MMLFFKQKRFVFLNRLFFGNKISNLLLLSTDQLITSSCKRDFIIKCLFFKINTINRTGLVYKYFNNKYLTTGLFCSLVGLAKLKSYPIIIILYNFFSLYYLFSIDFFYKNTLFFYKIPLKLGVSFRFFKLVFFRRNRKYRRIKKWLYKKLVMSL